MPDVRLHKRRTEIPPALARRGTRLLSIRRRLGGRLTADAIRRWDYDRSLALYREFVVPGDLVFDIGANLGNRVERFLALSCRVVAVEPLGDLARRLIRHYRDDDVVVVNSALGRAAGVGEIMRGSTSEISTMSKDFIERTTAAGHFEGRTWSPPISVPVTTLDLLIQEYGVPAFTKIDTEGYEFEVLNGLSKALPALSVEYSAAMAPNTFRCLSRLAELGSYEFAYSYAETMEWAIPWCTREQLVELLGRRSEALDWGDVYARRPPEQVVRDLPMTSATDEAGASSPGDLSASRLSVVIAEAPTSSSDALQATMRSLEQMGHPEVIVVKLDSPTVTVHAAGGAASSTHSLERAPTRRSEAFAAAGGLASREALVFLDAGDELSLGSAETVMGAFDSDPSVGLVYGVTDVESPVPMRSHQVGHEFVDAWRLRSYRNDIPSASAFISRDAYDSVGGIDGALVYGFQHELYLRLSAMSRIHRLGQVTTSCREEEGYSVGRLLARVRETRVVLRRHTGRVPLVASASSLLDGVRDAARLRLAEGEARWLSRAAVKKVVRFDGVARRWLDALSNEVWADGWVGPQATFDVSRAGGDVLAIELYVPEDVLELERQALRIAVDGVEIDTVDLLGGGNSLRYALPTGHLSSGNESFAHVELWARRRVALEKFVAPGQTILDRRKVSLYLLSIATCEIERDATTTVVGRYPDGWASPSLTLLVPPSTGSVSLTGHIPEECEPLLGAQRLRARIAGRRAIVSAVKNGAFQLEIDGLDLERITPVHVQASRWVSPREAGPSPARRLAYLVDGLTVGSDRVPM